MVDLEAHAQLHVARVRLQLVKGRPHRLVVEVGATAVRRAGDRGHAGGPGRVEHREALGEVARAVIDAGQDMAVDVAHGADAYLRRT